MKRLNFVCATVALTFTLSTAFAIGMPKIKTGDSTTDAVADKTVSTAKNKAIADDINNKIKGYNCAFQNSDTKTDTTCNLDDVINTIKSKKDVLETFGLANVHVYIKAGGNDKNASDRSQHIRDVLYGQMNWWHYDVNSVRDGSNNLNIWVEVKD